MYIVFYGLSDLAALLATLHALISEYYEDFVAVQRSQSGTSWNLMCICNVPGFSLMIPCFMICPT